MRDTSFGFVAPLVAAMALVTGFLACTETDCEKTATCAEPVLFSQGGGATSGGGSGAGTQTQGGGGATFDDLGTACTDGAECESGECVDGVCCDLTCDGPCEACNLPGSLGTCSPDAAGESDAACEGGAVCDGFRSCAGLAPGFVRILDGNSIEILEPSLAFQPNGGVVLGAAYFGTPDLGGGPLPDPTDKGTVVARWDNLGQFAGQSASDIVLGFFNGLDMVVDSAGNWRYVGRYSGSDLFNQMTDEYDVAYLQSSQQTPVFINAAGDQRDLYAAGAYADGGYVVGGPTGGTGADFGGGPISEASYLVRFDGTEQHVWSRGLPGTVTDVSVGPDDATFVAGSFTGTVDLGGGDLTGPGTYLLRLDEEGNHVFSVRFSGPGIFVRSMAASASRIAVGGDFDGGADFGAGPVVSAGNHANGFALILDAADGSYVESVLSEAASSVQVGVDANGVTTVVLAGSGGTDFGGGPVGPANDTGLSLARFGLDGTFLVSRFFDVFSPRDMRAVVAPDGRVAVYAGAGSLAIGMTSYTFMSGGAFVATFGP